MRRLPERILPGFGVDVQRDAVCDVIICRAPHVLRGDQVLHCKKQLHTDTPGSEEQKMHAHNQRECDVYMSFQSLFARSLL